jgi:hypothetical protein
MTALTAALVQVAKPQTQADKMYLLSFAIQTLIAQGFTAQSAQDAVLGAGSWDAMVSELYDTFRAEA